MITKLICKIFKLVHIDSYEQMRRTLNNEIHALMEQYNSEVLNYEQNLSILRRKIEQLKEENKFLKEELSIANKRIEELLMERDGYLLQIKSLEELISKQRKESLLQKVNYENIVKENDSLKDLLKSYDAKIEHLEENLRGQQDIYKKNIERVREIFIPITYNQDKQQEIIDYLDKQCAEIDNLISEKEALIVNLEEYKKSLIYEYVTGKKAVN